MDASSLPNPTLPTPKLIKLGGAMLVLYLLLPLFACQPFWFGYYHQSEPLNLIFWGLGAATCIWLIIAYAQLPQLVDQAFRYPVAWGHLLLAAGAGLLSLLHCNPLQTWFGSPEMGEGVFKFLVTGLLAAQAAVVLHWPVAKRWVVGALFGFALVFGLATYLGGPQTPLPDLRFWKWAPYYFPDYLAYAALAMLAVIPTLRTKRTVFITASLAFAIVCFFSENKSLWYGLLIALGAILAMRVVLRTPARYGRWLPWAYLGCGLGFILILCFYKECLQLINYHTENATLEIRGVCLRISFLNSINWQDKASWLTFLFGRGFGRFQDLIAKNVFEIKELSIYNGEKIEVNHEALTRDFFHNHNAIAEHFTAIGVIGLGLSLWIQCAQIRSLRRDYALVGGIVFVSLMMLNSFWFELPATYAYLPIALILITEPRLPKWITASRWEGLCRWPAKMKLQYWLPTTIMAGAGLFLFISVTMAKKIPNGLKRPSAEAMHELIGRRGFEWDTYLGGSRSSLLIRAHSVHALAKVESFDNPSPMQVTSTLAGNIKAAQYLFANSSNCQRASYCNLALNLYGELASSQFIKASFIATPALYQQWKALAYDFLQTMPTRTDMLVPLFNFMVLQRHDADWARLARSILATTPDDPIGLWFSGSLKLNQNPRQAFYELNKSMQQGIHRFIPLSDEFVAMIKKANTS